MNAIKNEAEKLPEDVELLLPWHAAGTLSRRDAARVEQALANDNELAARYEMVREELGEAIRLNETLGAPSARAMQKLFAKIDAEPARKPKVSFNLSAWLTDFVTGFSPRTLAYGATAAALLRSCCRPAFSPACSSRRARSARSSPPTRRTKTSAKAPSC